MTDGIGYECTINIAYSKQVPMCPGSTSQYDGNRLRCRGWTDLCVPDHDFTFDFDSDGDVRLYTNKLTRRASPVSNSPVLTLGQKKTTFSYTSLRLAWSRWSRCPCALATSITMATLISSFSHIMQLPPLLLEVSSEARTVGLVFSPSYWRAFLVKSPEGSAGLKWRPAAAPSAT